MPCTALNTSYPSFQYNPWLISKFETSAFSPETIGNAVYKEDVNYIMISLPRALIGETDKIELEFKWTDGIKNEGDLLSFYETGK